MKRSETAHAVTSYRKLVFFSRTSMFNLRRFVCPKPRLSVFYIFVSICEGSFGDYISYQVIIAFRLPSAPAVRARSESLTVFKCNCAIEVREEDHGRVGLQVRKVGGCHCGLDMAIRRLSKGYLLWRKGLAICDNAIFIKAPPVP